MIGVLMSTLIYMIPLAAIAFFVVSLCNFTGAKRQFKAEPNEMNEQKKNTAKTVFITSLVIMGVLLVIVIGFMALMFMAIAYM